MFRQEQVMLDVKGEHYPSSTGDQLQSPGCESQASLPEEVIPKEGRTAAANLQNAKLCRKDWECSSFNTRVTLAPLLALHVNKQNNIHESIFCKRKLCEYRHKYGKIQKVVQCS
jgi:hypothetical protein